MIRCDGELSITPKQPIIILLEKKDKTEKQDTSKFMASNLADKHGRQNCIQSNG